MWLWLLIITTVSCIPDSGYWLAGPNSHFYLIGKGKESWTNAREYCLARNADLVSVDGGVIYGWLLQHFMPSPRSPGAVQVGLYRSFFPQWRWLNGGAFQEGDKIEVTGDEDQCAILSLRNGSYLSVACDQEPDETTRFICERTEEVHQEQQKTESHGLWARLHEFLEYLGFRQPSKGTTTTAAPLGDLEDPGTLAKDIEHAERLLEEEGSGLDGTKTVSVAAADRLLPLPTREAEAAEIEGSAMEEGSGAEAEKELTEGSGAEEPKKKAARAEEIENDFNEDGAHIITEDVPVPPKKDDCLPAKSEESAADLLATLRQFLSRAAHSDLKRLVDDDSHTLKERLLRGISEANARDFEAVQPPPEEQLTDLEKEMLLDELSKLLVPDETTRVELLKRREEFA